MKRYFLNLLLILVALALLARGAEDLLLFTQGESAQARIAFSEKAGYGRFSSRVYRVHFEFRLPDGSLQTGSTRLSVSGGEPTGWLNVRYFSFRPDFNKPAGTGILLSASVWMLGGLALLVIQALRIRRKKRLYARAARMKANPGLDAGPATDASPTRGLLGNLVAALVLLSIGAALAFFLFIQPALPRTAVAQEEILSTQYGNTQGNVANGGIAVRAGSEIYFANFADNQRLYRISSDGSGLSKLTDESVSQLNFHDGWIYFANFDEDDRLYRIKPDGSGMSRVYKWKSEDINLSGGWFFLSNGNDHDRIYRVRADGKQELQLNSDESENLSVGGGWIYYTNATDGDRLYRIRTNGTLRGAVTEFAVSSVCADETGVMVVSSEDGFLYRLESEDPEPVRVTDRAFGSVNVADGWIYYANDEGSLAAVRSDGSEKTSFATVGADFISLLGDKAMVVDFMETGSNSLVDLVTGTSFVIS